MSENGNRRSYDRAFKVEAVRLVKEMRLRGITTREEANAFLLEYLPTYNQRFRVIPANKTDVHVRPERYFNPDRYLCLKANRTVRNDKTVAHNRRLYQIKDKVVSRKVIVEERLNGSVLIGRNGVSLKYREITQRPPKANPPQPPPKANRPTPPSNNHPWRRSTLKTVIRKRMYNEMTK